MAFVIAEDDEEDEATGREAYDLRLPKIEGL